MALPKLFNPSKPGPGVSKDRPQKKRFFLFWELYFRKFWKLIQANLIYVLFSLPVVTVGLADAGLTYITRNYVREKHAFVWGDFIDTIKKNWKQALPMGLLNLLFEIVLIVDVYYYSHLDIESSATRVMMTAFAMLLLVVFTFMRYYIPLMIVTFKLSWKQIYKNAFIFSLAAIFQNILISIPIVIFYGLLLSGINMITNYEQIALTTAVSPDAVIQAAYLLFLLLLICYVLFFPAFRAFLIQFCIFPKVKKHMIDPYYEAHPQEDREQRQALNIPDEFSEQKAKEEAVFVDRGRTDSYLSETEKEDLPPIPKQYSEREMRRFRESQRRARGGMDADDDGTI